MEKSSPDGYILLLLGYARSSFRDLESYLRIVVGLDEKDIQLILKHYKLNFVTYEISPGIYTIKDISEAAYTKRDHEGTLQFEYDDKSMKAKVNLTRFSGAFGTLRFDEKSFYNTLSGFTSFWDCKPTNAIHVDSPSVYNSDKSLNLSTKDELH